MSASRENIKHCVVLDAMGVLFQTADDVEDLLIPFIRERGGTPDENLIRAVYLEASLGKIGPDDFWAEVSVSSELENEYLERHQLSPGVMDFFRSAALAHIDVWCLSNDVGRWSRKLRERFGLERYLTGSVISSEVRSRKPSREIYDALLNTSGRSPGELLFWDDREKNVIAARSAGIESRLFKPDAGFREIEDLLIESE